MDLIELLEKLWPFIAFVLGIIWKQISQHFEVKSLIINIQKSEAKIEILEKEFNHALNEHGKHNQLSIDKLTDAVTELIKITSIIATKIEAKERYDSLSDRKNS